MFVERKLGEASGGPELSQEVVPLFFFFFLGGGGGGGV